MWRNAVAVVAGIVTMSVVIFAIESVVMTMANVPEDFANATQDEQLRIISMLPLGALVTVVVAWVVGGFGGGLVAGFVAEERPLVPAVLVGLFDVGAVGLQLLTLDHPFWMQATGLLLPLPAAVLGGILSRRLSAYDPPGEPPPG